MHTATALVLATVLFANGLAGAPAAAQEPKSPAGIDPRAMIEKYEGKLVDVPARGATSRAYIARPHGEGPHPAVVILHGTEGFTPTQPQLADDFAAAGFVAIAACWFKGKHMPSEFRTPPNLPCPNGPPFNGANLQSADYALAIVEFARSLPGVDPTRVTLWGHSRGGTIALLLAAKGAPVRAVVAAAPIYAYPKRGGVFADDFPIRYLAHMKVPILMMQGSLDQIIPVSEAREFETAARKAGLALDAEYYDGMGHNLFYTGSTRDAARGRAIAFLRKALSH